MFNQVGIMGKMVRDPELRTTGGGVPTCSFTIACDRDFREKKEDGSREREADYIDCVAWRDDAEFVAKYFRKNSSIVVKGRLQERKWVDKAGNKRRNVEVVAENVYFGDRGEAKAEV